MRACTSTLIACLLATGCTTEAPDSLDTADQGVAELRVDATSLLTLNVTRVTVEAAGDTTELVFHGETGTFDASLFLPAGPQSLTARAYADTTLVGASNPVAVDVQPGVVTRVALRIIDLSVDMPIFGPIVDSLTYPTTTQAGSPVTFTIAAVAPANDPVVYDWTTNDCPDSTFTSPHEATTSWSKPTAGACTITAAAISNGVAARRSFVVTVFPAGADTGAVSVSGVFVARPGLELALSDVGCSVVSGSNASCPGMIAAPATTSYVLNAYSWGLSTPGTLAMSDNCGGLFFETFRTGDVIQGRWQPPIAGGVCILTAHAVNSDGGIATVSAAVLTRAGTPPQPPQIALALPPSARLFSFVTAFINVSWFDGLPGSVVVIDTCGGGTTQHDGATSFNRDWQVSSVVASCTVTVQATNTTGVTTVAAGQFQVVLF